MTPTSNKSVYGANVTLTPRAVTVTAFSGPRALGGGGGGDRGGADRGGGAGKQVFRFDVAATPSKPLNLSAHFEQRYLQVGYGTKYISPQEAAARNVSVVTLHQGIPGIINGTLVGDGIVTCEPRTGQRSCDL
jgi:hypothetical protein